MGNLTGSNESDKIPMSAMSDSIPMLDDVNKLPTSHAVFTVETALNAKIDKKTAVRYWDNGTFLNGTPNTGDVIIFSDSTTIASGGNAVFYLTSDHTASGTALCSSILANSIGATTIDSTGVYSPGQPTITSNKTITYPYTKRQDNALVVLGLNVLGIPTQPAAPNTTVVRLNIAVGISV